LILFFQIAIYLTINKRLKSEEDRLILKQFKADNFNEDIPIKTTIKKYFQFTDEINTSNNIAYTNYTCSNVSKTVRKY
jgi:hypothetical protein